MLRVFIVLSLLFIGVQACKMNWVYGQSSDACIMIDGKKREFRYFIPSHAKGVNLPLLIALHGGGGNPKRFEAYSRFSELSMKGASYIVVYPKGVDKHWNDGRSNVNSTVDDVKFISRLIEILPHVLKEEVYVTGMSNGGLMTQRLACDTSLNINGIAVVGATMSLDLHKSCENRNPMQALFIFGTEDNVFLDNGKLVNPIKPSNVRGYHIGIDKTLAYWKRRNLCKSSSARKELNEYTKKWGKFKDDETKVHVIEYKGCNKKLKYYKVEGGGHRWPDKKASNGFIIKKLVGKASLEMSSADEIIEFFGLIKR